MTLILFNELINRGIEPTRLQVIGLGTSSTIVQWNDNRNNWQNRRVEFSLTKEPKED